MESDLGLEPGVRIQLAGKDHRVFWPTQRRIEGHTGGIRRSLRRCTAFSIGEGGEEGR